MHLQVEQLIKQEQFGPDDASKLFPFELDAVQKDAIDIVLDGHSVVVSAPTGSGKTAIASVATVAALARCALPLTAPFDSSELLLCSSLRVEFRREGGAAITHLGSKELGWAQGAGQIICSARH